MVLTQSRQTRHHLELIKSIDVFVIEIGCLFLLSMYMNKFTRYGNDKITSLVFPSRTFGPTDRI